MHHVSNPGRALQRRGGRRTLARRSPPSSPALVRPTTLLGTPDGDLSQPLRQVQSSPSPSSPSSATPFTRRRCCPPSPHSRRHSHSHSHLQTPSLHALSLSQTPCALALLPIVIAAHMLVHLHAHALALAHNADCPHHPPHTCCTCTQTAFAWIKFKVK